MRILVLILFMALTGCAGFGNIRTTGTFPDGKTFEISSKPDALVEVEKDGVKIKVDNRGRPGLIEQIIAGQLSKPVVRIGKE